VVFYIGESGRQHIYLDNVHTLLALYNHCDFLKMHIHNAWLFGKSEVTVVLQEELFSDKFHLFVFLWLLFPYFSMSWRRYYMFRLRIIPFSSLIFDDTWWFSSFNSTSFTNWNLWPKLHCIECLLHVKHNGTWFPFNRLLVSNKFPCVDTKFFISCFEYPYQQFRKMMLNFQLHNRRYHKHFYQRWLGHGHCLKLCDICSSMDTEIHSNVSRDVKLYL
jgi:hypothetical protein